MTLTMEEKHRLCKEGKMDINEFLQENRGLVGFLINRRYQLPDDMAIMGISEDDMVQVGMVGLWKAYQTFKTDKGIKWATYATRCIKNEIGMLLRFHRKNGRYDPNMKYLDVMVAEDLSLGDVIPSDDDSLDRLLDTISKYEDLKSAKLSNTQKKILVQYLANPNLTMVELSEKLGVSQSYISSWMKRVRKKLNTLAS